MTTLAEFMIIACAENRPLMLEKSMYDSWKSQNDTNRTKRYEELSVAEKLQAECDLKDTNIVLQGLPQDLYAIVNHHKFSKEIWDRVKLLMQGTKLSLQEKECKLYDEFDKFSFMKGETLYQYYWRFAQLINNMNVNNMSMRPIQVNTKFLNNLPPEWSKFVTDVKLARDFHTTNYDQLPPFKMAGLLCNKFKGGKDKFMLVMAIRVMLLVLGEIMQKGRQGWLNVIIVKVKDTWIGNELSLRGQETLHNPGIPDGQTAQTTIPNTTTFQTKDLDAYDSDCDDVSNAKVVLMANLSNYGFDVILEENANQEKNNESLIDVLERYKERVKTFEQRLNIDLSKRKKMINSQMDDMIKEKLALKQQIDSLEQNLSNQIKEKESLLQTFTVFKNESKEKEMHMLTKPQVFYDDTHKQALVYQNPFYLKKDQRIKPTLYDGSVISSQHAASPVIDDEETLILEEVSRSKMLAKQNKPMSKEKKVNTTLINYVELNRLSEDFGKCFVLQRELYDQQAFWLQTSHPNTDQHASSPVKIKAPKELPKITPDATTEGKWGFEHTKAIFLKEIIPFLKTLKVIFNVFDKDLLNEDVLLSVMNSTTLNGEFVNLEYFENNDLKAKLQAKDTIICKLKEHIKYMRENDKEEKVKQDMDKTETINIELEHSVAKLLSENESLHKEIKHLKKIYKDQFDSIKKTCALSKEHYDSLIAQLNSKSMENADLKGQIQEKVFVTTALQNELRRLKGKHVLDNATIITNATTIAQGMFKLDIEHISHRLENNRDANEDYLKKTIENTDTIRGLIERARKQNPSEPLLDSTCKFTKHVQELFTPMKVVHLKETTSNSVVTPKPEIKVYSRRPKQIKTVGSSKKAKIVESRNANNSKPNHSWGSNAIDVPSCSSLVNDRLSRVFSGIWTQDALNI
ncbi:hypothetical protein Tco_0558802 [Tanacetum coccineum]